MSLSSLLDASKAQYTAAALGALVLCVVPLLLLLGQVDLLRYLFPLCAFGLGLWLYATTPVLYIGFTFWIWFLTPFVRRLLDYEASGFNPTNPVMVTPLLVTMIAGISLFRYGGRLRTRSYYPFFLILAGILHGYLIGVVYVGFQSATFALLTWLLPVLFGLHVAFLWRLYPSLKKTLRTTFGWGLLVMGMYGVYQYFMAPAWDMMWLEESGMTSSMGLPEAAQFRVFSTLNSTGPFAFVGGGLLLLLIDGRGLLAKVAALPGYVGVLLTLVRAAWVGWVVGIVFLVWRLRGRLHLRLMGLLAAIVVLGIPLFLLSPVGDRVAARAQSFTNLEGDYSYQARLGVYARGLRDIGRKPMGDGIGNFGVAAKLSGEDVVNYDSGVFEILFSLGWLGALLFVGGLVLLIRQTVFAGRPVDPFEPLLHATALSYLFMLLFSNLLIGVTGMIFWAVLGLALGARVHARGGATDEASAVPVPEPEASPEPAVPTAA